MWPLLAHALEELAPILAAKPAFIKNVAIRNKKLKRFIVVPIILLLNRFYI